MHYQMPSSCWGARKILNGCGGPEKVIENVHLNMAKPCRVQIQFEGKNVNVNSGSGLQWISRKGLIDPY